MTVYTIVVERSRSFKPHGPGSNQPDRYVGVLVGAVEANVRDAAEKPLTEGNRIKYDVTFIPCGVGYNRRYGPRSRLGHARMCAHRIATLIRSGVPIHEAIRTTRHEVVVGPA